MSTLHDSTLYRGGSYAKQSSMRHPGDRCLVGSVEGQEILELKSIPWLFVVLIFGVVQAEYANTTNWRSGYENTQLRYLREEAVSILRSESLYPLAWM